MNDSYSRFEIARPDYLGDDHWSCIERETDRLRRSLTAGDGSQALSDIKCLVESISRIVLDVDGTPAAPNTAFETVAHAHALLTGQPGHQLANVSPFGQLATQASKIAKNLGSIRNEFGGGHGRARTPDLRDEMVALALDGGLLWAGGRCADLATSLKAVRPRSSTTWWWHPRASTRAHSSSACSLPISQSWNLGINAVSASP